jgi:rare lipoprotein A (peptidoglycan hydrolase)
MKRTFLATSLALVVFMGAVNAASQPLRHHPECRNTFTVAMDFKMVKLITRGTRTITRHQYREIGHVERCERTPWGRRTVVRFNHAQERAHDRRVFSANPANWPSADTSWYDDAGGTACGVHATYGVANKTLPCGTRVQFAYGGRQVTAVVQDRGPYVGDRMWDLNQGTAGYLGFDGVHWLHYRIL